MLTRFDEILLLKGALSMLIPVAQNASSIVWHFISSKDQKWLSYSVVSELEHITIRNDEEVVRSRH